MKKYDIVRENVKSGKRIKMNSEPMSNQNAVTMRSKLMAERCSGLIDHLVEVSK